LTISAAFLVFFAAAARARIISSTFHMGLRLSVGRAIHLPLYFAATRVQIDFAEE